MRFAICALALLAACSGGGSNAVVPPAQSANLDGEWTGVWASGRASAGGGITATLVQQSGALAGEGTIGGSQCFGRSQINGGVTGNQVTMTFGGAVRIQGQVTPDGDQVNGAYEVFGGLCAGDSGAWTMMREKP